MLERKIGILGSTGSIGTQTLEIVRSNPDFKVIRGNEIYLVRNDLTKDNYNPKIESFYHFILLAKDAEGHKQIRELSTRAWGRSWRIGKITRRPTYYIG